MPRLLQQYQRVRFMPRMRAVAREYLGMQRMNSVPIEATDDTLVDLWDVVSDAEAAEKQLRGLLAAVEDFKLKAEAAAGQGIT